MLFLFVALTVVTAVLQWLASPVLPGNGISFSFWAVVDAAFVALWVSSGRSFAYVLILLGTIARYSQAADSVARDWDAAVAGLVVISAVQVLILVSPQVIDRVGDAAVPERDSGWAGLVAIGRRPPAWLLACGALTGVLATLACLGNMTWIAIAGCRPAASDACGALAEGYPLRWLTAVQNTPVIDKGALFKDDVQWTLLSVSVLYAVWLWFRLRREAA